MLGYIKIFSKLTFVFICCSALLLCGTTDKINDKNGTDVPQLKTPALYIKLSNQTILNSANYIIIDSLFDATSYFGRVQSPFVWYPRLNILATITRGAFPSEPNLNIDIAKNCSDAIKIKSSYDLGKTWNKDLTVYLDISQNATLGKPRYPSLSIFSEQLSEDKTTIKYACYAPLVNNPNSNNWNASYFGLVENNYLKDPTNDKVDDFYINNKNFLLGAETQLTSVETGFNGYCIAPGMLTPKVLDEVAKSEQCPLGLIFVDYNNETTNLRVTPEQWAANKFLYINNIRPNILVGTDVYNAIAYTCVMGNFAKSLSENSALTFAISKSTDYGRTWSEFNVCPKSVFEAYALTQGIDKDSLIIDYSWKWDTDKDSNAVSSFDFASYGEDEYSIVTEAVLLGTSKPPQIIEVYFKDKQWGIRKVTDCSLVSRSKLFTQFNYSSASGASYNSASNRGCEVQIARTQDNNNLIVKYIESVAYVFPKGIGRRDTLGNPIVPDTVVTTDVAMANKTTGGKSWGFLKNVTNTFKLDKISWIPKVIPNDLTNIPLLTISNKDVSGDVVNNNIDFQQRISTSENLKYELYKQYLMYSSINFNASDNFQNEITNIEQNEINTIYPLVVPNPATDYITLYVGENDFGTLEVLNTIGKVVKSCGTNTLNNYYTIQISDLESGTYYCKLKTDEKILVRSFVVIK